jgi:signal transduction histidine kinase
MFLKKLYVRIWLAVVLAVAVLSLLVGWAWQLAVEPPLREVVMRNEAGQVIGNGQLIVRRPPGGRLRARPEGDTTAQVPAFGLHQPGGDHDFAVMMSDGEIMHLQLPRRQHPFWSRPPFGFFWTLSLVAIAVALATYPIIRKLTRRLELLRNGVEKWGAGDLSVRMTASGHDEVAFLAAGFNHAAERIETLVHSQEALLASQKSLLANASHELRSPLTRIRMGLELMGVPSTSTFKTEISRNIAELDQLIEEILLASRLDAHEADLGTVESIDLIGLAAEECARVNAELEVQLTSDQPDPMAALGTPAALTVQGVAKLLRRAVRNLLENASRHGAGAVTVTLARTGQYALISVCDRGPGVPAELQERIFEPFYRLPGATERDGGVGLGLALVKSIARRHDGVVTCENRADGGACFVIRLPLKIDKPT